MYWMIIGCMISISATDRLWAYLPVGFIATNEVGSDKNRWHLNLRAILNVALYGSCEERWLFLGYQDV